MNNITLKYLIVFILTLLCQIFITEYLNIWHLLYIGIFLSYIISLPVVVNKTVYIITAFALGIGVDFFADGVIGLNAAGLVAVAYLRSFFLHLPSFRINLESIDNAPVTPKSIGLFNFSLLSIILCSIFFFIYILLDYNTNYFFSYSLPKFAICVIANTLVSILLSTTLLQKVLK